MNLNTDSGWRLAYYILCWTLKSRFEVFFWAFNLGFGPNYNFEHVSFWALYIVKVSFGSKGEDYTKTHFNQFQSTLTKINHFQLQSV